MPGSFYRKSVFGIFFLFINIHFVKAQDRLSGKTFTTRSEVMAQHGMACTSQPLATQAALDILKQGGTAVDAAIAANAVRHFKLSFRHL
jgi:gamma-glutamyltranspeptidase/glutathione hydrolase